MKMIKKIGHIKHLGIWVDYSWNKHLAHETLPDFRQYNIIYGLNGTGKTTLSKIFDIISGKENSDFPNLAYRITDQDDNNHTNESSSFNTPIRVFNPDWIELNIDFDHQKSKGITLQTGEKNIKIKKQIEEDSKTLAEKEEKNLKEIGELKDKRTSRDKEFTNIAKQISTATHGIAARNYNKNNAEKAFSELKEKSKLTKKDSYDISQSLAQSSKGIIPTLGLGDLPKKLAYISKESKKLLFQTVEVATIERLKNNPDISLWVEEGLKLQKEHSNKTCEFCGQNITNERLHELAAYFTKEDAKLKNNIDNIVSEIDNINSEISSKEPVNELALYQELQGDYNTALKDFQNEKEELLKNISKLKKEIINKKMHTTEELKINTIPKINMLSESTNRINDIIKIHNKKTNDFESQKNINLKKLEDYYLTTIYDKIKNLDQEISTCESNIESEKAEIRKLKEDIEKNKNKISSLHQACKKLNEQISTFLGHSEITFKVIGDEKGYSIQRKGAPAKNLSEGEKTAIAFVFFILQLEDDFDIKNSIVVIDDPVSSLDANSRFQAFSFLKNATKNAKQMFIFTHNFEFLKLLLNWLGHSRNNKKKSLYMVKNIVDNNGARQEAYLDRLDKALEENETEYQYLFKIIYTYKNDYTIETAYRIPNIARKLLESFLAFRIPRNMKLYTKLENIEFDENKKTAIYKFVNDESHLTGASLDPSLISETQNCTKYILELIESEDPKHYRHLVDSIE